jgi:hypothetical protein
MPAMATSLSPLGEVFFDNEGSVVKISGSVGF